MIDSRIIDCAEGRTGYLHVMKDVEERMPYAIEIFEYEDDKD